MRILFCFAYLLLIQIEHTKIVLNHKLSSTLKNFRTVFYNYIVTRSRLAAMRWVDLEMI